MVPNILLHDVEAIFEALFSHDLDLFAWTVDVESDLHVGASLSLYHFWQVLPWRVDHDEVALLVGRENAFFGLQGRDETLCVVVSLKYLTVVVQQHDCEAGRRVLALVSI